MTDESYATWAKTHLLAESLEDTEHQLVSLLVLWAHQVRIPDYPEATGLADRCGSVAERSGDRGAVAMANYMRGITYHHSGRILEAEGCLEQSLHRDDEASRQSLIERFGYDRKADALGVLANLVWLRGSPDHARRLNRMSIAEARQLDHTVPLCVALTWASFNMISSAPFTADLPKVWQRLISFRRGESSNRPAFWRGEPDLRRRNHPADRRLEQRVVRVANNCSSTPSKEMGLRLFLALRPPKLPRSSAEHMTEMTRQMTLIEKARGERNFR